ncbi:hypothetical protein CC85DRAFT_304513 [Cutaneotrichosporon oleaginosum]|uniref:Protein CPL1-like domain-containing protein n=1 Tax=Cutaneotrichosporon oleaginosum TaxID=879819 RepID=A0A0J0XG24_9TREE|nr:uncharacterized protein CC85DRAFT_304513 [Cutaneotrichosporon oleaginosum]KLT40023.1 hypothetical protein CC85DRAFT_304513 [Cutaneotrichosporon oleaginosum]TXT13835.1 hypothetical protein COLE_00028 [Cutaneotrichosporon oleaginosum]
MVSAFALLALAIPALAADKAFLGCFKNIPPGGPSATVTSEAACDRLCTDYPYEFYTIIKGGAARCQCADRQPNGLGNWQDAAEGDQCQTGDARGYLRNPPYTHTGECIAAPWFYSGAYSKSAGMFGGPGPYAVKTNPKQADTTAKCFDTCNAAGYEYAIYNAKPGNQMYCVCANGYRGTAGKCTGDTYYVYGRGGPFQPGASSSTSSSSSSTSAATSTKSATTTVTSTSSTASSTSATATSTSSTATSTSSTATSTTSTSTTSTSTSSTSAETTTSVTQTPVETPAPVPSAAETPSPAPIAPVEPTMPGPEEAPSAPAPEEAPSAPSPEEFPTAPVELEAPSAPGPEEIPQASIPEAQPQPSIPEELPTTVESEPAQVSALRKRGHSAPILSPSASRCMRGLTACAIPGTNDWECIDAMNDLESCGGCTTGGFGDSALGVDCTALPGVKMSGVTCQTGRCVVTACRAGFSLFAGQCIRN